MELVTINRKLLIILEYIQVYRFGHPLTLFIRYLVCRLSTHAVNIVETCCVDAVCFVYVLMVSIQRYNERAASTAPTALKAPLSVYLTWTLCAQCMYFVQPEIVSFCTTESALGTHSSMRICVQNIYPPTGQ